MNGPARMSPFAQSYEQLIRNGYRVLPIAPTSKAPSEFRSGAWRPMPNWQQYRDAPTSTFILKAWAQYPQANIGILTGTRATSNRIVACVDFDTDDPDVLADLASAIPDSPVKKRGRRGHSQFYLVPNGTKGFRTQIVELLTDTRQTVIPPSVHPDTGQPYVWSGTATLLDTPASQLPLLTEDDLTRFREMVESLTARPVAAPQRQIVQLPKDESTVWRHMNNTAYENLDAWVPDLGLPKLRKTSHGYQGVAHWRPSSRGRPIDQRSANLSIIRNLGARDFGTGESYTAIDLVKAALSVDLDTAFAWLGGRLGLVEAEPQLLNLTAPPIAEPVPAAAPSAPVPTPSRPRQRAAVPEGDEEIPDHLTHVPGITGHLVNWIVDSSRRPNRALALGAALTVVGTLIGRVVAGPTLNATHLYITALAPSGAGKNHPLEAVAMALKSSNSGDLVGPSEFMSMPAVIKLLERKPLSVCAMDEIGAFFKRLTNPRASGHEQAINKILRQIWNINFKDYTTPEWASTESRTIARPALSIYGVSTQEEFFDSLATGDLSNGFLNRWLIIPSYKRARDRNPLADPMSVPDSLRLSLARLRMAANRLSEGDMDAAIGEERDIKRMGWGEAAEAVYADLAATQERMADEPGVGYFYARCAEIAIRLATIRAAGRENPTVAREDMEWGRDLSLWSTRRLIELSQSYISENENQRQHNAILRILKARGGCLTHRDLTRALNGRMKSRDIKDIMENMVASGIVEATKAIPPSGGTPTITYRIATE